MNYEYDYTNTRNESTIKSAVQFQRIAPLAQHNVTPRNRNTVCRARTSIFTVRHHRGINSNYRSEPATEVGVPFIRFETGGRSEAKPARKTERGKKDAETTIVLGNEA